VSRPDSLETMASYKFITYLLTTLCTCKLRTCSDIISAVIGLSILSMSVGYAIGQCAVQCYRFCPGDFSAQLRALIRERQTFNIQLLSAVWLTHNFVSCFDPNKEPAFVQGAIFHEYSRKQMTGVHYFREN